MGTRVPGALGCAATISLMITACGKAGGGAGPDFARYCVDKSSNKVIEDRRCDDSEVGDNPHSPFGWYYQQMPSRSYDEDGYNNTPDFVMIPNGGYAYGGGYARPPGIISGRNALSSGRVFTGAAPIARGIASSPGRVISRGGFGVAGEGSGGG